MARKSLKRKRRAATFSTLFHRIGQRRRRKVKIVFLCEAGLTSSHTAERFKAFLKRRGVDKNFEVVSSPFHKAYLNTELVHNARVIIYPPYSEALLTDPSWQRIKEASGGANFQGFVLSDISHWDIKKTFESILAQVEKSNASKRM